MLEFNTIFCVVNYTSFISLPICLHYICFAEKLCCMQKFKMYVVIHVCQFTFFLFFSFIQKQ